MSWLFNRGASQPSVEERMRAAEQEMDIYTEMFNRLTTLCTAKCIPTDYREGDLNKGESVCIDRCAKKFFECNILISEKMQEMSAQTAGPAAVAGAGGGLFGR